jgi:hypothetical protein
MSDNEDLKAQELPSVPMRDGVEELTIHISANRPGQLREDPRLDNYPGYDRNTPWNENHPVTMDESVLGAKRNTNARFLELLAEEANGAVETDLPEGEPLVITLIGPIRTWWGRLESPEYAEYNTWRKAIQSAVVHAGHLVYSPHLAWKGAWHEKAQRANDMAIMQSDVIIVMTPPGTVAVGTAAEIEVAKEHNVPLIDAPPGDENALRALLAQLATIRTS